MTNGGMGVGFFIPFDATRYFFPFYPIEVSPIGGGFFSARGLVVIKNELLWIWLPSIVFAGACLTVSNFGKRLANKTVS